MPDTTLRTATISVLVENEPGILARVVGLFSGRGYNIDSLTVAPVESGGEALAHQHRDLGHGDGDRADQGAARPAGAGARVADLTREGPHIAREMALIKVVGTGEKRVEALRIADAFRARVIDATHESFVFELTGGDRQARRLHRPDAPARAGRGVPHRRGRDRARGANDLG